MEIVITILKDVLIALYQPFWYAVVMAVLMLFFYMFAKEKGFKNVVKQLIDKLKTNSKYIVLLFYFFYLSMILFRTLLNRNIWMNPLSNILGTWSIYNAEGKLTTEIFENLAMFVPFIILTFMAFTEKLFNNKVKLGRTIILSFSISFLFSLTIELLQLFLRVGTFQLSDLFFNTVGGIVGGIIYYIGHILHRKQK